VKPVVRRPAGERLDPGETRVEVSEPLRDLHDVGCGPSVPGRSAEPAGHGTSRRADYPVSEAFGDEPVRVVLAGGPRAGADEMDLIRDRLAGLARGMPAELNVAEPAPTAAFSGRDRLLPRFDEAKAVAATHGFLPIIRPVGGHLAVYGDGALVLHHWASHWDPRAHIRQRFALMGDAIAESLRALGVDARVGPVPGEYCDGAFSVNESGRSKLVGTGQRIVQAGYLFSAVIMVHSADPARAALSAAYELLDLPFDPATVGCVADSVPGVTTAEVCDHLVESLGDVLHLAAGADRRGDVNGSSRDPVIEGSRRRRGHRGSGPGCPPGALGGVETIVNTDGSCR
jgi:octanoyl-[GcvH]:protein N-octanoyltransferase